MKGTLGKRRCGEKENAEMGFKEVYLDGCEQVLT
jgi:hypothetical protein